MQKIKKVFISLIIVALIFNVLPFKLFADTPYFSFNDDNIYYLNNTTDYYFQRYAGSVEIRTVGIGYSSSNFSAYFVVKSTSGVKVKIYARNGFSTPELNNYYDAPDGFRYYYLKYNYNSQWISNYYATYGFQPHITGNTDSQDAYYYTFGDGAIEPLTYDDLQDVGFYTKFTNSQQSNTSQMALNKDVITWDNYQDTNGNDLNDVNLRVDIQAASINYEANSKSDLLNQTINDMLTGDWSDLITISPNVGEYSFTWETVARALFGSNYAANWWNNLFNVFDSAEGIFYKKGWIYRIRLRTADNSYIGNWQIIYNITSAPPSDSEKVYNNYYVYNYTIPDEETYRIINNINTINNTTNNWYQNDVPFNPDSGSNWWEKLLEFISEVLSKILDFFSSIFDGLVDLILGLFDNINPADSFFNWFSDLFNGIHDIDLTLPQFNIPDEDLTSFNRLVQETLNIFSFNNFGFVIFIPLLLIIIKAVF